MMVEASNLPWRATFRRCYSPTAGVFALVAFATNVLDVHTASEGGILLLGSLLAGLATALPVGLYARLDGWRRTGRWQHYATWIAVCAVPLVPLALMVRYGLQQVPGVTSADVGGGPLILLGAALMGVVSGSVAESIERQQQKASELIAGSRARQPGGP